MKKQALFKKIILPILLIFFGAIYSFILPPYDQFDLAWFGMAPLLVVLRLCKPKAGFWYGLCFGAGFWFPAIRWFISLGNKGCPFVLVLISYVLLAMACATFTAIFSMLVARLWQGIKYISYNEYMDEQDRIEALDDKEYDKESAAYSQKLKKMARRIAFAETWRIPVIAIIWVGLEYLRELAGFSWNTLAVSQYKSYPVAQLAAVGGTAAISFLIVAVNAGIAGTGVRIWRMMYSHEYPRIKRHFDLWLVLILALVVMVLGAKKYRALEMEITQLDSPNDLILVGAINNHDTPYLQQTQSSVEIFNNLLNSTYELSTNGFDVVIWPETSIPFLLPEKQLDVLMNQFVQKGNFQLIVGGVENALPSSNEFDLGYNVSYLYSPEQENAAVYKKRHLVPFGEYLPFDETIPFIRNFAPFGYSVCAGEGAQLFNIKNVETGMLICFEDTFSWPARESVNSGARLLISHSNDMWFDMWEEKIQHHANAVFRAIETRTPLVRVSNEGYMGLVFPTGRTLQLYSPSEDIMREYVVPRSRDVKPTIYQRVGNWILAIPAAIFVVCFIGFMVSERILEKRNRNI